VIRAAPSNELLVPVIEVKIASQLEWRWFFGIAPIAALLVLGEELDRHIFSSAFPITRC
jgi:hypothetical protein